jgi:hypothetical protein
MGNPDNSHESIFQRKFSEAEMGDYFVQCAEDGIKHVHENFHDKLDKWEMDLRMLRYQRTDPYDGAPNFSSDVTMTMADSISPRLVQDLFDYNEPIDVEAVGEDDNQKEAIEAAGRTLMAWDANSNDTIREELYRFVYKAVGLGTSFAYTFAEKVKERHEIEYDSYSVVGEDGTDVPVTGIDENLMPVSVEGEQPIPVSPQADEILMRLPNVMRSTTTEKTWRWKRYGPRTICVHSKRVFWSPDAESLDDAFETGYVGLELHKTANEIMTMLKTGDEDQKTLLKKVSKAYLKDHVNQFKETAVDESEVKKQTLNWSQTEYRTKKLKLCLVFGKYDVDNDGLEEHVVVLCHPKSKQILGWERFPYDHGMCPIVAGKIKFDIEKSVENIGVAEMNFDDKGYVDHLRNERAITRERFARPTRYVRRNIGFNRAIHNDGNSVWDELEDIGEDAIRTEKVTTYDSDSYHEEQQLIERIQARFGLPNPAVGMETKSDQTLGGLIRLLEEGAKSRDMYKKNMAESIRKIFYQRYRIWKQMLTKDARDDPKIKEFVTRVMGAKAGGLEMENLIALDHDLNVTVRATHDDKRVRLIKVLDKYKLLSQEEMVMNHPHYRRKLIKDVLIAMGDNDVDSSIPTVEEYQQFMLNMQKQAMQEIFQEQQAAKEQQEFDQELNRNVGAMEAAAGERPVPEEEDIVQMAGGMA